VKNKRKGTSLWHNFSEKLGSRTGGKKNFLEKKKKSTFQYIIVPIDMSMNILHASMHLKFPT